MYSQCDVRVTGDKSRLHSFDLSYFTFGAIALLGPTCVRHPSLLAIAFVSCRPSYRPNTLLFSHNYEPSHVFRNRSPALIGVTFCHCATRKSMLLTRSGGPDGESARVTTQAQNAKNAILPKSCQ